MKPQITVEVWVAVSREQAWQYWTLPEHVMRWNFASDDWCCPRAENDLRVGGVFNYRMEAKDGSVGFDFSGAYTVVEKEKRIDYVMTGADARAVSIEFAERDNGCSVKETFEAENENSLELQKMGWQSILDNFKKYGEAQQK